VLGTEHRFAEEFVVTGIEVRQELVTNRLLRTRKGLLGSIVDAGDAQGKDLQGGACNNLDI
jgi:hypothetical protein